MKYTLFNDLETFPDVRFQTDSFQLEEFRAGDFSSMQRELNRIIPNNENLVLRSMPIVRRYAKDKGRPYIRRPHRTFGGISEPHQRLMEDAYGDLAMDLFMQRTSQREAPQNGIVVAPVPAGRRHRLYSFIPAEVVVERDDPLEEDIRYASKVTIRVPVRTSGNITTFGRLVFTQDEAWVEAPGAKKVGVFDSLGYGMRNPFGYIPCICARSSEPNKGHFWGPLNQALGQIQIATNVALSDVDLACRFQAHAKETLLGPGASLAASGMSKVRSGPDVIQAIDTTEEASEYRYEVNNTDPAIDKYLDAILFQLELFEQLEHIGSGQITPQGRGQAAITGRGKEVERIGEIEERSRLETMWQRFERELGWMVADMLSLKSLVQIGKPDVVVDFKYVEIPDNDLQSTQADILRYVVGRDSPGEQVAREENLDNTEQGWAVVLDRQKRNASFLSQLAGRDVPGLDSIAGFTDSGPDRGTPSDDEVAA